MLSEQVVLHEKRLSVCSLSLLGLIRGDRLPMRAIAGFALLDKAADLDRSRTAYHLFTKDRSIFLFIPGL